MPTVLLNPFHFLLPAPDNSPRIGASRVAQVVIQKNDNANGIVQLSSNAVSVHEPHSGSVVNVTRTAGDFGTVSRLKPIRSKTKTNYDLPARVFPRLAPATRICYDL